MNKTLLICDDDAGIVDMLEMMFEGTGYNIIPVLDSLQVMDVIEKQKPDVLILDLWMPVLSGDQVLKTLRSNSETKDLPVIVVSASRDGEKIAREAGATDYVSKPFDMDLLMTKVDKFAGAA
ncbi:response regulator [Mucilaginibacter ginkgonis]|uniref:Response regulator transcription factor n=1 Tax=Mucilaginibacter ginkgonis TaxID=2682091 RepID=A0A6I4HVP1_9SPHI|nr:response regulator [Mucilaginibacter ginkgonis]QQL51006.1 response regulator transcription factor [Mucilaginibacter ginkgonis]